jgi:hypothetical protein
LRDGSTRDCIFDGDAGDGEVGEAEDAFGGHGEG